MKSAQEEATARLRQIEKVGVKGDTQGQKDSLVDELVRSSQRLQKCTTDYEILSTMTVTFFRNLQRIDELIDQVSDRLKFEPTSYSAEEIESIIQEQSANTKAISELLRFVENEGQEIIMKSASESFTSEIRRECEKIPQIIAKRSAKWHEFVSTKSTVLEETKKVKEFEKQLTEIEKTISHLQRQLMEMKSHLGNSPQAVDMCKGELKKLEEQITMWSMVKNLFGNHIVLYKRAVHGLFPDTAETDSGKDLVTLCQESGWIDSFGSLQHLQHHLS
ncbi:unnamed protein product [Soboliphyme baturini]|uniref:BBC domain-containing protein n=1 Tax=Soboliphyme baturini TaxID=241478 RepID=A0A183J7L4_9BILA|nr:unnamed protein product [Soboliphyme baturini]